MKIKKLDMVAFAEEIAPFTTEFYAAYPKLRNRDGSIRSIAEQALRQPTMPLNAEQMQGLNLSQRFLSELRSTDQAFHDHAFRQALLTDFDGYGKNIERQRRRREASDAALVWARESAAILELNEKTLRNATKSLYKARKLQVEAMLHSEENREQLKKLIADLEIFHKWHYLKAPSLLKPNLEEELVRLLTA